MKQPHQIQLKILKKLLFVDRLRYTDIKPSRRMENNRFNFHLKELIKAGYIQKNKEFYFLTSVGKEYANRMDTDQVVISPQAKISVWLCGRRKKGKASQYLIYTRLKQPFYKCQGFPSGKVRYGETIVKAAIRELQEESGLTGSPQIVMVKHYLVFAKKTKELLEDKFMFLCLFDNPVGILKAHNEGKYQWVSQKDLPKYVTNHFESYAAFKKQIDLINGYKGKLTLIEEEHFSQKF